jgi:maltose alpha-D-glucosyltransferase/alpha-amylase
VELDLSAFAGMTPVEMTGLTEFPKIGQHPYFVTLPPYYFYWFRLQLAPAPVTALRAPEAAAPPVQIEAALPAFFMGVAWDTLLEGNVRTLIERESLLPFLQRQRWFGGKARPVRAAHFLDWGLLRKGQHPIFVTVVEVTYEDGPADRYLVPLSAVSGAAAESILATTPQVALARVTGARKGIVIDATADDLAAAALFELLEKEGSIPTRGGTLRVRHTPAFAELRGGDGLAPKRGSAEQSNTSIAYGDRLILKLFRRVESGPNPDVEIGEYLTTRTSFRRAPRVAASIEYEAAGEAVIAHLAVAQQFVISQADGWSHALGELRRFFDDVTGRDAPDRELLKPGHMFDLAARPTPQGIFDLAGGYIDSAQLLGRRTAELHLALAGGGDDAFAAEAWTHDDTARLVADAAGQIARARVLLDAAPPAVPSEIAASARDLIDRADAALHARYAASQATAPDGSVSRIRVHGDYHLGQVLWSEGDFYILDFEGEPARPLEERRFKESPLKDVAGMLRSFGYAANAALFAQTAGRGGDAARLEPWARVWQRWTGAAFVKGYLAHTGNAPFLPPDPVQRAALLDLFLLDKTLYELNYELNNRPDWARIPLQGVSEWLG